MIKGCGKRKDGTPFVLIGLSEENVRRLREGGDEGLGRPIRFNLREIGLSPMMIGIFAAKTDEGLVALVQEFAIQESET